MGARYVVDLLIHFRSCRVYREFFSDYDLILERIASTDIVEYGYLFDPNMIRFNWNNGQVRRLAKTTRRNQIQG